MTRAHLTPLLILAFSVVFAAGLVLASTPANSQGPGGPGECCTNFCGLEPPCPGGGFDFSCEMFGMVGTWPNCNFPVAPTCEDSGLIGTYPNCYAPVQPTCADSGLLGTYPNCYAPPQPTCEESGLLGTYPNCYAPPVVDPPSCELLGLIGTYPNCYAPPLPTCGDLGMLGTWPNCYAPPTPTCADTGQLGTYPFCYDPPPVCVPNEGDACNTNVCGVSGGTVQCDGSCSGSTPAPIDQCPSMIGTQCSASACPAGPGGGGACPGTDTVTITATPNRVDAGDTTPIVLAWSGGDLDATSCTVTNLNTGSTVKAATAVAACSMSDSFTVPDVSAQTTFRLECGSLRQDVVVNIVPQFEEF